jgi:hypothetical protein
MEASLSREAVFQLLNRAQCDAVLLSAVGGRLAFAFFARSRGHRADSFLPIKTAVYGRTQFGTKATVPVHHPWVA